MREQTSLRSAGCFVTAVNGYLPFDKTHHALPIKRLPVKQIKGKSKSTAPHSK